MPHSDVLRLTIPQIVNLMRAEQKQGGPTPTATRTRIEWEQSRADSVAINQAMETIRRGRKRQRKPN